MGAKSLRGALTRVAVAAAILSGAASAGAAPVISLNISSVGAYDSYSPPDGTTTPNPDGTFSLSGVGYGSSFNCDWSIVVNPDPSISGTFNLTNLSTSAQTFILTITLPVTPLAAPTRMGGSFGDVTYTDANGDSTVTLMTVAPDTFYRALIDAAATPGAPPIGDLGSFTLNAFGGPGVFGTISKQEFGAPIPSAAGPAVNSSIGIRIKFNLTAGDRVEIPVFFRVEAPEPSSALLIGLGLAALVAARKRARA